MADCEVEGTIASPLASPREGNVPTEERRDEARNIRTRQNPFGPQERQTRIDRAVSGPIATLNKPSPITSITTEANSNPIVTKPNNNSQ
ncbi:hypothetical protein TNCV_565911 [Trichonephila clavipes]|nr:hypothetical protein TNCV_565911 [Trichonephila clavipes]